MIDVLATLERLGIEGRESGDEMVARCPMHLARTGREDQHPSFSINLQTGLFLCFSCGYRGSLFTLVSDLEGIPLVDAESFVVKGDLKSAIRRMPPAYTPASPRSYLPESRLAPFCPPPAWACRLRDVSPKSCSHYGVLWSPYEESWILPIRDPEGFLIGWQEKGQVERLFKNHPAGVKKSRTLFGYHLFEGGRMVVVESPLDAVRLHSQGISGAVATYGAIVSRDQIRLMSAADEVVMALDADEAGRKASRELLSSTKGVLKSVRFFAYSEEGAKDPGDLSPEGLQHGISHARSRVMGEAAL